MKIIAKEDNPYELDTRPHSTHNHIIRLISDHGFILDIGCNDGYIGYLSGHPERFYGVDYMASSVKKTKKIYADSRQVNLNNFKRLPWDVEFHTIVLADVLEHVLFPREALLKLIDTTNLAPEANIIISLPNIANWRIRILLLLGRFNYTNSGIMDRTHLHFYTFRTAYELVKIPGYKIIHREAGASLFGPLIRIFPFTKGLLATNIIVSIKKVDD